MPPEKDRIAVHPRVISTIAALTALSVPGVDSLPNRRHNFLTRLFRHGCSHGVELRVDGNSVFIDLHLTVNSGFNLLEVSRAVQETVSRAIAETTDMQVKQVNVHVDGVKAVTYS